MGNNYTEQIGETFRNSNTVNPEYAPDITKSFIIGRNGVAGCDFNFAAPANANQQNLGLGAILPAQCVIKSITALCTETVAGGPADFRVSLSFTSGGTNLLALTTCKTNLQSVSGVSVDNRNVANNIFLGGIPTGANWSVMNAGKWLVTLIYDDYSKV